MPLFRFGRLTEPHGHWAPPASRMPRIPIRPPRGFRFGSTPPSIDCLVHLDNDRPYHGARRGERLLILKGPIAREVLGEGEVIGRMDSDDPRANTTTIRPPTQGIFFRNEHGVPEWRACQRIAFWRREDGVLQFTR